MNGKNVSLVATVLVVVGALNWGLVGFFNYDLVAKLADLVLDGNSAVNAARVVYAVVGLAGAYKLADLVNNN